MTSIGVNVWARIRSNIVFTAEGENHPHTEKEQGHLFSSRAFEETELEYLDFLYGLVSITKPKRVLETGTHLGLSAVALSAALTDISRDGYVPIIDTVEQNQDKVVLATRFIESFGLSDIVSVYCSSSLEFLRRHSSARFYDLVYFDSSRITRLEEFRLLHSRGKIVTGSILIFHDTSVLRGRSLVQDDGVQKAYLNGLDDIEEICSQRMDFPLSRGLTVFRL